MNWILRALCLVVAYDLSEYRRTVVFFVLSNMAHSLKMFARLIRIEQVKASKKVKYELFTSNKKKKPRREVFLATWKIPKLKQIFKQSIAYEAGCNFPHFTFLFIV